MRLLLLGALPRPPRLGPGPRDSAEQSLPHSYARAGCRATHGGREATVGFVAQHRRRRFTQRQRQLRTLVVAVFLAVIVAAVVVLPNSSGGSSSRQQPAVSHQPRGPREQPAVGAKHPTTYPTPDGVGALWVVAENRRPGTSAWNLSGQQTATGIMGYADHDYVRDGRTVTLRVSTAAPSFHVEAYRMGYYQGLGARLIWRSGEVPGTVQPPCPVTPGINMVECSWPMSLPIKLTSSWVQGQYLIKLVGSGGQQSYVPLTVWDPGSHAAYIMMAGTLSDQVFNSFGGYDLYQGATACATNSYPCSTRSRVVSYDRPYNEGNGSANYLTLSYPLTRFAEQQGLDVTYWTDVTLDEQGNLLNNHRVLISPGHDEEWSQAMRVGTVAATNKGLNIAFMGASAVLRKVRLQPSALGSDRQVVNYREPTADPLYGVNNAEVSQNDWTQAPANDPPSTIVGATYIGYNNQTTGPLVVSTPSSWLFAGTGLAQGATIPGVLASDMQAYDPFGKNPPGVEILSHSPVRIAGHPERPYADTTYYTLGSSHAGVFDTGTIGWIPALADCSPSTPTTPCPAPMMRALTGNMLRVLGSGPAGDQNPSVANASSFFAST